MEFRRFGESSSAGGASSEQNEAGESSAAGSASGGGGSSSQKRPVRRDPEKRRQQNARAQARHREKIRQRLESTAQNQTQTPQTLPSRSSVGISRSSSTQNATSGPFSEQMAQMSADNILFEGMGPALDNEIFASGHNLLSQGPGSAPSYGSSEAFGASSTAFANFEQFDAPENRLVAHDTGSSGSRASRQRAPDSSIDYSFVDCGCLELHVQFSLSRPNQYRELPQRTHTVRRPFVADPYINSLRVDRVCLVQATWANCAQLGYTHELICNVNATSPLVRGTGLYASDASLGSGDSMLHNIPARLTLDLRPTPEQLTIPHHPVIDILPFPTFRTNLIRLQGGIRGAEMFDDLVQGLVCWGGIDTRGDGSESLGRASTGMPWDSRSWEARTWFLQKYWELLGGEDGELVRQSRWWREIRGEDTNLWDQSY